MTTTPQLAAGSVPFGGQPKVNDDLIKSYSEWLASDAHIPKLFIHAVPGAIFANPQMLEFVQSFKNQKEITVYGGHFVQEVSTDAIGRILAEWFLPLGWKADGHSRTCYHPACA